MWNGEPLDGGEFVRWRDWTFESWERAARAGIINEVEHARKRSALLNRCNERRQAEIAESIEEESQPSRTPTPISKMWPGEPEDPVEFDKWRLGLSRSYYEAHQNDDLTLEEYSQKCAALLVRSNERNFAAAAARSRGEMERGASEERGRSRREISPTPEDRSMVLKGAVPGLEKLGVLPEPEAEDEVERLGQVLEDLEERPVRPRSMEKEEGEW